MNSLLLGALKKDIKNNGLDNMYQSNMENNMNQLEKKNANILKNKPEFFQQFDSLTFDKLDKPNPYITNQNDFTDFENSNMHYGVVTMEQFTHNNMFPTTSRRDHMTNIDSKTRKYENLSGNNSHWKHKKEIEMFFEPTSNVTNVNGMPVVAGELTNRYNPSYKNNYGNLPFQTDLKVLKGVENGVQVGPYSVYRVNPRNVDQLRSENNRKTTYINKPLETIKKGDFRAPDLNLTKFKLPAYREITTNDLVPTEAINKKMTMNGKYVHVDSQRGEDEHYHSGPANNPNASKLVDISSIKFTEAKRENYENDFAHAFNAVNTRPVFTNADSYTPYETERMYSEQVQASGAFNNVSSLYYKDNNYIANPTQRQVNPDFNLHTGAGGVYKNTNYVFSKDSVLPTTTRETTTHNIVLNSNPIGKTPISQYTDNAKETHRQTISENNYVGNAKPINSNNAMYNNDEAKPTIRQTTENNDYISNAQPINYNHAIYYIDEAKPTVKQTTVEQSYVINPKPISTTHSVYYTDTAKTTVRQTTVENNYVGNNKPVETRERVHLSDEARRTLRELISDCNYVGNSAPLINNTQVHPTDEAKTTIKETTENNNYISNASTNTKDMYSNYTDEARITLKETTLFNAPEKNMQKLVPDTYSSYTDTARTTMKESTLSETPSGRFTDTNSSNYVPISEARTTIKQTTIDGNHLGVAAPIVNLSKSEMAERNMSMRDKREQTAQIYYTANPKSDQIRGNINRETVRYNDKRKVFEHIPAPAKSLDYSITPLDSTYIHNKTDLNGNNFYKIDPIFIATLNDNPLVNNTVHQKNLSYTN